MTAKPTAVRGAAPILSTTSATNIERTMTQQVPGVAAAMKSPVMPARTIKTMTTASERAMFASWQQLEKSMKSNGNAAVAGRNCINAAAIETPAMQTQATNAQQTASKIVTFREYKRWLAATGLKGSNSNTAVDGRIPNSRRLIGESAAAETETTSMLAVKSTMRTTSMLSKTPLNNERWDAIPEEGQNMVIEGREGVNCTLFKDCVFDGFILHDIATQPSYASILKKEGTRERGYALAAGR